jgi:hypothetical protein
MIARCRIRLFFGEHSIVKCWPPSADRRYRKRYSVIGAGTILISKRQPMRQHEPEMLRFISSAYN